MKRCPKSGFRKLERILEQNMLTIQKVLIREFPKDVMNEINYNKIKTIFDNSEWLNGLMALYLFTLYLFHIYRVY